MITGSHAHSSGATQMPAVIPSACFLVQQLRVKNCVRRGWGRHSGALPPSNCFQLTSVSDSIKPGFTGEETGPTPCTTKFQLAYLPRSKYLAPPFACAL